MSIPARSTRSAHELGLDRSLGYQYVHWIGGVVRGNFGKSYYSQFPVTTLISERVGSDSSAGARLAVPRSADRRAGGDVRRDLA